MKVGEAIAEILKREGVDAIFGYPVNHVLESAACAGIRPIIVRQERVGLHMADALSRLTSGRKIGVFAMQHGPGSENSFGGVAQAYSESVPILVLPMGYADAVRRWIRILILSQACARLPNPRRRSLLLPKSRTSFAALFRIFAMAAAARRW